MAVYCILSPCICVTHACGLVVCRRARVCDGPVRVVFGEVLAGGCELDAVAPVHIGHQVVEALPMTDQMHLPRPARRGDVLTYMAGQACGCCRRCCSRLPLLHQSAAWSAAGGRDSGGSS